MFGGWYFSEVEKPLDRVCTAHVRCCGTFLQTDLQHHKQSTSKRASGQLLTCCTGFAFPDHCNYSNDTVIIIRPHAQFCAAQFCAASFFCIEPDVACGLILAHLILYFQLEAVQILNLCSTAATHRFWGRVEPPPHLKIQQVLSSGGELDVR